MSCDLAINIRGLSKAYPIYARREDRLKQLMLGWRKTYYTPFWALRDVDLEIARGESFGLIGRNGSGKSTLLQIIAGTTAQTSGELEVNGRVAALLQLGAGFNPEFSGRENVFLNAAILGLTRAETEDRFDDIAAFADIGEFLDRPVKQYSSGMFMRLAFAVQANVAADIVIVDEALAVGDVFFRQKCYRRLRRLQDDGATLIIVSHSINDIEEHCARAAVLEHGAVTFVGESTTAAKHYYMSQQRQRVGGTTLAAAPGDTDAPLPPLASTEAPREADFDLSQTRQVNFGGASCVRVALSGEDNVPVRSAPAGGKIVVTHAYRAEHDLHFPFAGVILHSDKGVIVHGKNTLQLGCEPPARVSAGATIIFRQEISVDLKPGEYTIEVGLGMLGAHGWPAFLNWTPQDFEANRMRLVQVPNAGSFSVRWSTSRGPQAMSHYGAANLNGAASYSIHTSEHAPMVSDAGADV